MSAGKLEPGHERRDLQIIGQAIRKGWNIPDVVYENLPSEIARISLTGSSRDKIAAAKVLAHMVDSERPRLVAHHHRHHAVAASEETQHQQQAQKEMSLEDFKQDNAGRLDRLKRLGGNAG